MKGERELVSVEEKVFANELVEQQVLVREGRLRQRALLLERSQHLRSHLRSQRVQQTAPLQRLAHHFRHAFVFVYEHMLHRANELLMASRGRGHYLSDCAL